MIYRTNNAGPANRLRGLLTQIHPALKHVLGPRLITRRYSIFSSDIPRQKNSLRWVRRSWQPSSANLRLVWVNACSRHSSGTGRTNRRRSRHECRCRSTATSGTPSSRCVSKRRGGAAGQQRVLAHPLYPVLTSIAGVGVRTAARLLTEVACRAFASAAHLAAYAGLAPVTRRMRLVDTRWSILATG